MIRFILILVHWENVEVLKTFAPVVTISGTTINVSQKYEGVFSIGLSRNVSNICPKLLGVSSKYDIVV